MPHTRTLSEVSFGGGGTSGCAPSVSSSAGGLASYSYAGGFAPDILLSGWVAEVVVVGGRLLMSATIFAVKSSPWADIVMSQALSLHRA